MQPVKPFPVGTFVEPLSALLEEQKPFAALLQANRVCQPVVNVRQAASAVQGPVDKARTLQEHSAALSAANGSSWRPSHAPHLVNW